MLTSKTTEQTNLFVEQFNEIVEPTEQIYDFVEQFHKIMGPL